MIKKILFVRILVVVMIFSYACASKAPPKPPKLDASQLRSLQVKEIEGDIDTCFKASLFILQDEGWIIKTADKTSGLIQGESLRTKSSFSPNSDYLRTSFAEISGCYYAWPDDRHVRKVCDREWERWEEVNVTVEAWGKITTKLRLSLVKKGLLPQRIFPEENETKVVDDPTVYQNFYARLKKEVFRRQNLNK